ncbi:hypothetical protein Aph01nite_70010 [Acrocarpospora phusangensis]|uniref:DUF2264 domain-containing protein n=1 Tax=Acrocarpospora phusangensis TaxID=1070424 RepID=A0A919QH37_9ACTN|nr:DUF2264 domain-containing protein [Acrocarpospora phusangensis]GIH28691.1 hypothetical protein Aph01nite_70010 [Acrocarpospora phusangensis]
MERSAWSAALEECGREETRELVRELVEPLLPRFSPGRARLRLGANTAHYPDAAAELEAFARPLWGLAPLAAGGADFAHWDLWREGLANGTDPAHPEYWGPVTDIDQRLVETAAIGFALALAPERLWDPLTGRQRDTVATWLRDSMAVRAVENNWQFFPVLVGLGLDRVGVATEPVHTRLDTLESYALGPGWYSDGRTPQRDYYIPFAMHYYALIYAALTDDTTRAARLTERAAVFAHDFQHWFTTDGAAVPYGRSMTYRFAQGAFWGALAFAGVEALPWPVIKGHLLRHLRWWLDRPIRDDSGLLTIGYAYPQPHLAEQYNAPGSPYWALKAFLPLALPSTHPFWQAEEAPAPDLPATSTQPDPGVTLMRCDEGRQVIMLTSRQHHNWVRHGAAKYTKFAYSTAFGFSVPAGTWGLDQGAFDSTLALSEDGDHWRPCEVPLDAAASAGLHYFRWSPSPDVDIETWLIAHVPWHLRVHRIHTVRTLHTAEGAFALNRDTPPHRTATGPGHARIHTPAGLCQIESLSPAPSRHGDLIHPLPGTNVIARRTTIPTLRTELPPGTHWLTSAVLALTTPPTTGEWLTPPTLAAALSTHENPIADHLIRLYQPMPSA